MQGRVKSNAGSSVTIDPHRDLVRGVEAATHLFRKIHLEWSERPLAPGPEWFAQNSLRGTLGDQGVGIEQSVHDFERWILSGALGVPDPRYVGLVNSSPLPTGPLADLLVSALDNNAGAEHQGPSAAAAEREVLRTFGEIFLDDPEVSGMVLPGGSFANLQGLVMARARAFPEWEQEGPTAVSGMPTVYVSEATHFSGSRGARVMGIGEAGLRGVPTDSRGGMRADALREMVENDRRNGRIPFAIVGTTGTTGTGAFDPIDSLADIADAYDMWLHVDACYGGAAIMLPELAHRFTGIKRADSVAVDPHKWFFLPLTCSLLLLPEEPRAGNVFDVDNSYIPAGDEVFAYRRGIPTSRRATAITLWMTLRAHGLETVRSAVRENIRLTRLVETLLADAGFAVLPGNELSVACARWTPDSLDPVEVDQIQTRIAELVLEAGRAWFSTVRHEDKTWLRINILNIETTEVHVKDIVAAIVDAAPRATEETLGKRVVEGSHA